MQRFGPLRFNDLRDRLGTVTPKVLTQRLRRLERDGLVERVHRVGVPPRVDYSITELGLSLSPAFHLLVERSEDHVPAVEQARRSYDRSGRPRPA